MKKAITYMKNLGFRTTKDGEILSRLPDGEKGLALIDGLREETGYTIIGNKLVDETNEDEKEKAWKAMQH